MEISFPTDEDGFLSQECPGCELRFKAFLGQGSANPISYCPYCCYSGEQCWFTQEQVSYMQAVATYVVVSPELQRLQRDLMKSSGGFFKIAMESSIDEPGPPPIEPDSGDFSMLHFPCCNETIKVTKHTQHFCIICGKEIDMEISESKKVFLSHSGSDKDDVREFKSTLELIGYEPWIDEDAMPAGTMLEKGILKGMQHSCAAIFFITPAFKDEGYLETEIQYAIAEKRKKGDQFAIVALLFEKDVSTPAVIPDLLRTYVWKNPKSQLEALKEIIRALPVLPHTVVWRPEISGVVNAVKARSIAAELSEEARRILLAAANVDGHIMMTRTFDGVSIDAGNESLVPDQAGRTVAKWISGLEELQRRQFIKDLGHKGEVFEVTQKGYDASDTMNGNPN